MRRRIVLTAAIGLAVAAAPGATAAPSAAPTTAVGQVFKVNPVQSTGNENLTDNKDADSAIPASEYALVPLRNLDGSGTLTGKWVNVRSETGNPARSVDGKFVYCLLYTSPSPRDS